MDSALDPTQSLISEPIKKWMLEKKMDVRKT